MKNLKVCLKALIMLVCFWVCFNANVKADENVTDLVDYVAINANISEITTTIIPEQVAIETSENKIKIVSSEILDSIPEGVENFVIGDARVISEDDYYWLCKIVECEAGGEDEIGKILVANVVFNRFDTGRYGKTLKGVIFAKGQFSPVSSGSIYKKNPSQATINAVNKALDGIDYSQGALYFMYRKASDPDNVTWFDSALTFLFKHGHHEFFK